MKVEWWANPSRFGIRPGLERIRALMDMLDRPYRQYPIIHVAGTNGKGSTSSLIAEGLMSQGWRVGLYTSPDLGRINERVMINRIPLSENQWDALGDEVEKAGVLFHPAPSFFEAITALAFLAFAREQVDVAVVEVGLGGRLDATNCVENPILTVITPIALDHVDRLGPHIEDIACEKAGILKSGVPLVLARQSFDEADRVIRQHAHKLSSPVITPATDGEWTPDGIIITNPGQSVTVPLGGIYQTTNVATAQAALQYLATKEWIKDWNAVARAWQKFRWPGRFEMVAKQPLTIIDGAHNPHGIAAVLRTLSQSPWKEKTWHVVFGVFADKAVADMLHLFQEYFPLIQSITLTQAPSERGLDPMDFLEQHAWSSEISLDVVKDPHQAVKMVRRKVSAHDAILVTGSLALLAELRGTLLERGVRGW